MAIRMFCPKGHELVTEDQYAGRKVRCPHCQAVVIVPSPAPAAVVTAVPAQIQPAPPTQPAAAPAPAAAPRPEKNEIDEGDVIADEDILSDEHVLSDADVLVNDDRPRTRRRRRRDYDEEDDDRPRTKKRKRGMTRKEMSLTNLGLGFHYAMIVTILVAMLVNTIASLIGGFAGASAAGGNIHAAGGALGLAHLLSLLASIAMFFAAPALGITGSILCCWVPSKTGAKPLIITALGLEGGAFLLPILGIAIAGAGAALGGFGAAAGASIVALMFVLLSPLLTMAAFILFMLFLRKLAEFLGEHGDADEAMSIVISACLLLIGGPIGLIILFAAFFAVARNATDQTSLGALGCMFLLFLLIASIVWFVFVIKLLFRILNLIGSLRQILRTRFGV